MTMHRNKITLLEMSMTDSEVDFSFKAFTRQGKFHHNSLKKKKKITLINLIFFKSGLYRTTSLAAESCPQQMNSLDQKKH